MGRVSEHPVDEVNLEQVLSETSRETVAQVAAENRTRCHAWKRTDSASAVATTCEPPFTPRRPHEDPARTVYGVRAIPTSQRLGLGDTSVATPPVGIFSHIVDRISARGLCPFGYRAGCRAVRVARTTHGVVCGPILWANPQRTGNRSRWKSRRQRPNSHSTLP